MDFGEFGYLHVKVRGGASEDSSAEKSMFVSSCADGDDENSVWWMLVNRSVACFAWRHFDSPTRVIE